MTREYAVRPEAWDYIVVGGGSAGCVVAKRLAEDAQVSVLLLEAGAERNALAFRVPGGMLRLRSDTRADWRYVSQPDASRAGQPLLWNAGKALGGGSAINGMVFNRGLASDYDSWRDSGCPGWGAADVLPSFERLEHFEAAGAAQRGAEGPVGVEFNRYRPAVLDHYLQACREVGIPVVDDVNAFPPEGMGRAQASTWRGTRQTTANTYLRSRRRNLTILTAAQVHELRFEDQRCTAVRFAQGSVRLAVRAQRAVVLCAGTFGSPPILQRSGIGPPELLIRHGIQPVHALEGVGRNLQEHPGVGVSLRIALPSITAKDQRWPRAALHGLRWLLRGDGTAAGAAMIACGYARSHARLAQADLGIQLGAFAIDPQAQGEMRFSPTPAITSFVNVCRPRQRGCVELGSPDPDSPPKISLALLGDADDRQRLVAGVRLVATIHAAAALRRITVGAPTTDWTRASDEAVLEFIANHAGLQYHPVGTCRMGSDAQAVVDPTLRVRGLANLYVADASIMPQLTSANTNGPVMMIGERAAELIRRAKH